MKNNLFQLGDSLLRILDSSGDLVLVIDCAKQTMPVWISVSDIALYKPISEENLANVIGKIPELETLDNEQIRTMHECYVCRLLQYRPWGLHPQTPVKSTDVAN